MSLGDLGARGIRTLGPYLLGREAWRALPRREFRSWVEFRRAVDRQLGLSEEALWVAFRGLQKNKGESDEEFILRVEE